MSWRSVVSGSSPALDLVAPSFRTFPDSFTTLGPEVADLASDIGFPPDPEQRMLLDMMYAMRRDRTPAAFEFCVICSRQNLKTGLFKMAAIADAFYFHEPLTTWTAHQFDTTEGAFRDIKALIDGSDMLTKRVRKITAGHGDEEITLTDGSLMQFKARMHTGGRGKTGGKIFLDEGFALQQTHIGSLYPIMATIPGAQVRIGSSAGLVASVVLRDIRDRGRKGDKGLAYAEWSDNQPPTCDRPDCDHHRDAEGCCLDDRDRWRRSNPAMGRRISEERIETFRRSMPPAEFAREFLGWWDEETGERVITELDWQNCFNEASQIVAAPMFALDVAPSRAWAAIAAAGLNGAGKSHLEVTGRDGVTDHRPGTDWVVPRLVELRLVFPDMRVVIAAGSAAEALKPAVEAAGIPVDVIGARDVAAACGLFYDHVVTSQIAHLGQPCLDAAVAAAKKRVEDGETAWVWGRKRSSADITPLYAATLALWALVGASNLALHPINNVW
jgi:hypothetical protein